MWGFCFLPIPVEDVATLHKNVRKIVVLLYSLAEQRQVTFLTTHRCQLKALLEVIWGV